MVTFADERYRHRIAFDTLADCRDWYESPLWIPVDANLVDVSASHVPDDDGEPVHYRTVVTYSQDDIRHELYFWRMAADGRWRCRHTFRLVAI